MRAEGSWMGLVPSQKRLQRASLPFHHVRTQRRRQKFYNQKKGLTRTQLCWHTDPGLQPPTMKNKFHAALTEDKEKSYFTDAKDKARILIWQIGQLAWVEAIDILKESAILLWWKQQTSVGNPFKATKTKTEKWQSPSLCHFSPPGPSSCSFFRFDPIGFTTLFKTLFGWEEKNKFMHDILRLS